MKWATICWCSSFSDLKWLVSSHHFSQWLLTQFSYFFYAGGSVNCWYSFKLVWSPEIVQHLAQIHVLAGLQCVVIAVDCAQLVLSIPTLWVALWPSVPLQVTQTRKSVGLHEDYSRHHSIVCWLSERKREKDNNLISCSVVLHCSAEAILFISFVKPCVLTDSHSV